MVVGGKEPQQEEPAFVFSGFGVIVVRMEALALSRILKYRTRAYLIRLQPSLSFPRKLREELVGMNMSGSGQRG
jgi:hypothetical protein